MIYQALVEAADRDELILQAGCFCRFHLRRDGVVVIREILVLPGHRRVGLGTRVVEEVARRHPGKKIIALCPADNCGARAFYTRIGWQIVATGLTRNGKPINTWSNQP